MPRQKALPRELSMQGEDPAYVTPNDARGEPVYVNPTHTGIEREGPTLLALCLVPPCSQAAMPRQKALPRELSMQGEDPAYVTPNDARGEPVYVNPSGNLADAENVIYERSAADASEDEPEYLTLKDDTGDKGDQPRYTTLKVDALEGMKTAREGGEGSEQPPAEADVLAAGDSGILKHLYQRMTALERGFRTISITLGLMYLVNLALVIYITAAGYQPSSQPARQPSRAEEILTVPKEVLPLLKFLAGELGGTGETWQRPGKTWQQPGKTWQQPGGVSGETWQQPGTGETNASRDPPTTPNSLKDAGFRTATFTTLGATGRAGPTSLGAHYRGQDHEKLVTLQDGIQFFTVPETGNYRIEVAGAAGGWDSANSNKDNRGYGAMMRGNFKLHKGEVLKILIGQEGAETKGGLSSGGGGGTFVARFNNTPLIIAGGGGGMQWLSRQYASCDGTTLPSGQRSYLGVKGREGNASDEVNAGGGRQFGARGSGTSGGEGGYAFMNGGKGGRGTGYNTDGGFGGGGGAYAPAKGSGGGGGYSGGGRGPNAGLCECGGGGGSFNAGTDKSGRNGKNDGPGYAVITAIRGNTFQHHTPTDICREKFESNFEEKCPVDKSADLCRPWGRQVTSLFPETENLFIWLQVNIAITVWLLNGHCEMPRLAEQGEDPAYVTPNDARGEPVYVNPPGDLTQDVLPGRPGESDTDAEPMYLTLKSDSANSFKVQGDEEKGSAAALPDKLSHRFTALETSFRRLYLMTGFAFLVNLAILITVYTTGQLSPDVTHHQTEVTPQVQWEAPNRANGMIMTMSTMIEMTMESWNMYSPPPTETGLRTETVSQWSSDAPRAQKDAGFVTATFTTLGATGRAGPTSLGAHYRGQDHEKLVTLQDGIQLFTVPETGDYRIEVAGAAGGWDYHSLNASVRGHGAMMSGTFRLYKGEVLKILVGQEGLDSTRWFSSGGGGGTFVTRFNNTPLIIAGGGGGIEWLEQRFVTCDGTTLTSGQTSYRGEARMAGSLAGRRFGGSGTSGGEGGHAFVNGGQGGRALHNGADGGFGGGGGAYGNSKGSGGGGGYSGGGRGPCSVCECGGGGGSFNAGTDAGGQNGTNAGPVTSKNGRKQVRCSGRDFAPLPRLTHQKDMQRRPGNCFSGRAGERPAYETPHGPTGDPGYESPHDAPGDPVYENPAGSLPDGSPNVGHTGTSGSAEASTRNQEVPGSNPDMPPIWERPGYETPHDASRGPGYESPHDVPGDPVYENPTGSLPDAGGEKPGSLPGFLQRASSRIKGEISLESRFTCNLTFGIQTWPLESNHLRLSLVLMYLVNLVLVTYITGFLLSSDPVSCQSPSSPPSLILPEPNTSGPVGFGVPAPPRPSQTAWRPTSFPHLPPGSKHRHGGSGFRNATFTTLGATGRAGPTSLGAHYRGQDHEKLVTLQDGIQLFIVPETGDYRIEAAGAAGGWDSRDNIYFGHGTNPSARGRGALMEGTFQLRKGEVLKILVGQEGEVLKILVGQEGLKNKANFAAGGGGGTFVTRWCDDIPLVIAGGGGGIEWLQTRFESCDGTTLPSGQAGYLGEKGRAGRPEDQTNAGGSEGQGATEGRGYAGGGGGGFLTNGGSGLEFAPGAVTSGGEGGYAFVNGGQGGRGLYNVKSDYIKLPVALPLVRSPSLATSPFQQPFHWRGPCKVQYL
ncbi:hypothetical protein Bbelb_096600 [Branchiostoma belcheri]|nr:hypothetical protein Bbelb_096600 [Branchiostoma belcheri]